MPSFFSLLAQHDLVQLTSHDLASLFLQQLVFAQVDEQLLAQVEEQQPETTNPIDIIKIKYNFLILFSYFAQQGFIQFTPHCLTT